MTPSGAGIAGGSRRSHRPSPTTSAAYNACALASYDHLKIMLSRSDRTSTSGLLIAATLRQCEGDVERAEVTLRRALDAACAEERPYVVDMLAPLLISRGKFARAAAILGPQPETAPRFEAQRLALHAIVDAALGNGTLSLERVIVARELLADADDEVSQLRAHQRLALAAYYRGDVAEALDEVARGLRTARMLVAYRPMCTLHMVAYATYYSITGDFESAWRHAHDLGHVARHGHDAAHLALSRVAIYEMAAERGDDAALDAARAEIEREPLPEQYRERFSAAIADVLRLAWSGQFATARSILTVLRDTSGRTESERALCRGLLALVSVALSDLDAARKFSRQAISNSARPDRNTSAYEMRYRRLARALAAIAGELIGDIVRGRRAVDARFLRDDADTAALLALRSGGTSKPIPVSVRGYARLVGVVRDVLMRRAPTGPLTDSETEIVRLLAAGRSAPQIAVLLNRSPHTVRTHIRNVSAKLEAHGRLEIIARVRELGILQFQQ